MKDIKMNAPHLHIHGGVQFIGEDSEATNIVLDLKSSDPVTTSEGHIWYNITDDRVKYSELNSNNQISLKSVATTDDIRAATQLSVVNTDSRSLLFGQPVYSASGNEVASAGAGNSVTRTVVGLVAQNSIEVGVTGNIQFSNELNGTISQWFSVTNNTKGLIPGADYFLSEVPGQLTTTPPSTDGSHICYVGRAVSPTTLFINIQRPIAL